MKRFFYFSSFRIDNFHCHTKDEANLNTLLDAVNVSKNKKEVFLKRILNQNTYRVSSKSYRVN